MKEKEINTALKDAVKYKLLKKGEKGYIYNKENLTKLSEGIKGKGSKAWIELLWKSGYFEIARSAREISNIITLLTLK